ncbi:hypothetical protein F4556_006537 [Kitasatospora gansuensis]|uniref:Uncharacterized protein n=1 Tax=Kitasatospora gansuensis TaxID=258050 RepID=A0A7W7SIJ2_9ACTN|nr:hypothetical protein [Kitasatospora gansuensis]
MMIVTPVKLVPEGAQAAALSAVSHGSWTHRRCRSGPLPGRIKNLRFACSADVLKMLRRHRKGESDLIERDGSFYLHAVCDVPEASVNENRRFGGRGAGAARPACCRKY